MGLRGWIGGYHYFIRCEFYLVREQENLVKHSSNNLSIYLGSLFYSVYKCALMKAKATQILDIGVSQIVQYNSFLSIILFFPIPGCYSLGN